MASPQTAYRAFLDPEAVASWRTPEGMKGRVHAFEPREGGTFRMSFTYTDAGHAARGKTSEHADVFHGRFVELVPDERIVEAVEFETDDPAFAGAMTVITGIMYVGNAPKIRISAGFWALRGRRSTISRVIPVILSIESTGFPAVRPSNPQNVVQNPLFSHFKLTIHKGLGHTPLTTKRPARVGAERLSEVDGHP
ncbi:MAG: hypothetical protein GEU95_17890 [Rhizobiales bacterium]|nr:hypothetical protein [Hyphomicrobiales bacterium]